MRKIVVFVAALAIAGFAQAQTKKELAAKVLQLQQPGIENVGRGIAAQTAQQVVALTAQALARVPADKRDAVANDARAEVKKFYDEIEPLLREQALKLAPSTVGVTLEERFSEDELKQLIAWLESPVSKKYEQLARESSAALQQKLIAETRPTIEPKLKALEQTLGKRMGFQPRPAASAPASTPAKK